MAKRSIPKIIRRFYVFVCDVSWLALALVVLTHGFLSWLGHLLSGETSLLGGPDTPFDYVYYYMVTATTVGYGDMAPETQFGRMWAVFFVVPGGIAIFSAVLAKLIVGLTKFWSRTMNGDGDFSALEGAYVIIGHHPLRTSRMIEEIIAGKSGHEIVLLTKKDITSPDARIYFVRGESLTCMRALKRAAIENASGIVVYADDDEQTLAAALAAAALNKSAHMVCYFAEQDSADLLRSHLPHVEYVVSSSPSQVVRALQDPGSSEILSALSSTIEDETIYSFVAPVALAGVSFAELSNVLLRRHDATLIAAHPQGGRKVINPPSFACVTEGMRIFYIRATRLDERTTDWQAIRKAA